MTIIPFTNLGQYGVVNDTQNWLLPPNAWTDARNVRFRDGGVVAVGGELDAFEVAIAPYFNLHTFDSTQASAWIVAGLEKVYGRIGETVGNITRQTAEVDVDYSATASLSWQGGVLGGIPIINNGIDVPQQWAPVSLSQKLVALSNWPAAWRCGSIRPFKSFLIAMNMTEADGTYIHRVRTSHPAVPGAVPSSWDATDPTLDATRFDLSDNDSGPIIDGLALRDLFIICKQTATWGMQFVGGRSKFRVFSISEKSGVLARNCITPEPAGLFLFIAAGEDIMMCDGQKVESLLSERQRRWLQGNIDQTSYQKSYCVTDVQHNECWFCFPSSGSDVPDLALVWEKRANSISFRDLDGLTHITGGAFTQAGETWAEGTGSWDEDELPWDELQNRPYALPLIGTKPSGSKLVFADIDGIPVRGYLERTGLAYSGLSRDGVPQANLRSRKLVSRIWLQGEGGPLNVRVSGQEKIGSPIKWTGPRSFNLDSRKTADFTTGGVLYGIRLEFENGFELNGMLVDVIDTSDYVG